MNKKETLFHPHPPTLPPFTHSCCDVPVSNIGHRAMVECYQLSIPSHCNKSCLALDDYIKYNNSNFLWSLEFHFLFSNGIKIGHLFLCTEIYIRDCSICDAIIVSCKGNENRIMQAVMKENWLLFSCSARVKSMSYKLQFLLTIQSLLVLFFNKYSLKLFCVI